MRNLLPLIVLAGACTGHEIPIAPPETTVLEVAPWTWEESDRAVAIARGEKVLAMHQCNRCHIIDEQPKAARADDCVSCHVFIDGLEPGSDMFKRISEKSGEATLNRYQHNIEHLKTVPNLTAIGKRIRPDWIAEYVLAPYDLRPGLSESMIRTNLTPSDAASLSRYFAAVANVPTTEPTANASERPEPTAERLAQGESLFKAKACHSCHTLGNRETGMTAEQLAASPTAALAPNLRFAKDRMSWDTSVDWIQNPQAVWPPATMPPMGVSQTEAEILTDYLFFADPQLLATPAPTAMTLPPPHDADVSWAEVKEATLGKVCVHCHMNDYEKDPGAGNQGGLGYTGNGLRMRTYETLVSGYEGGKRNALMGTADHEMPPILTAMLLRRRENQRDLVAAFGDYERPDYPDAPIAGLHLTRGMPMGLPAMSDAEVALLAAWIAQGCPGPTAVTGQKGADDGFLVRDGPIVDNHGCGVRALGSPRPAWAVDQ